MGHYRSGVGSHDLQAALVPRQAPWSSPTFSLLLFQTSAAEEKRLAQVVCRQLQKAFAKDDLSWEGFDFLAELSPRDLLRIRLPLSGSQVAARPLPFPDSRVFLQVKFPEAIFESNFVAQGLLILIGEYELRPKVDSTAVKAQD